MKKLLISAFVLGNIMLWSSNIAYAGGGGMFGGATEITQIANNTELASILGKEYEQIANQIQQITNQVQQYTELVRQGKALTDQMQSLANGQFGSLSSAVAASTGIYKNGSKDLGYTIKSDLNKSSTTGTTSSDREEDNKGTVSSTAAGITESTKQQEEDYALLNSYRTRNSSAYSPMAAAQIGNEIGMLNNEQLIKIRGNIDRLTALEVAKEKKRIEERDAWKKHIEEMETKSGTISVTYTR